MKKKKKKLDRIYYILGIAADEHAYSNTCRLIGDKEAIELQDFLRSIAKPEQKSDWSEEDEANFQCALSYVNSNPLLEDVNVENCRTWIKSLKDRVQPQSTWKPSEEHIHGLIWVINRMPDFKKANEAEAVLRDLLEQLNKLRKG